MKVMVGKPATSSVIEAVVIPTVTIERVTSPNGGTMVLSRRGTEYTIRVDGIELMCSRNHVSEDAIGEMTCIEIAAAPAPRVLIGGLGLGFTLRAALNHLSADARVDMAELVGDVIRWNQTELGHLAQQPLSDPRVTLIHGDVGDAIKAGLDQTGSGTYDAIILDVDNGPDALTKESNVWLYRQQGLLAIHAALKPNGVLSLWSAFPSDTFTKWLERAGFAARVVTIKAKFKGGPRHFIWLAKRI
jgi:spermidine synthase